MTEILFTIENSLKLAIDLCDSNPIFASRSDVLTLRAVFDRISRKAEKVRAAKPLDQVKSS